MKKESDLDGVKAIAKALLMTDICKTPYSPVIVQHPFTSTGFVVIPTEKHTGFQPIDITLNDENLKKWQDSMRRIIEKAENPYHVYMLLNPPYALTFLNLASPYLSKKDFSEILSSAWVMCEAPHNDPDVSKSDLISMFKSADSQSLITIRPAHELCCSVWTIRMLRYPKVQKVRLSMWTMLHKSI